MHVLPSHADMDVCVCEYVCVCVWRHTLALPPAPWSWMEIMGLSTPSSMHVRITRLTFCSISASPLFGSEHTQCVCVLCVCERSHRCTALKSSEALLSPCARDEAAPPPMPMR